MSALEDDRENIGIPPTDDDDDDDDDATMVISSSLKAVKTKQTGMRLISYANVTRMHHHHVNSYMIPHDNR